MSSSIDIGTIRRHTNTPKKIKALSDNAAIQRAIDDQIEDSDFKRINKITHDRMKLHDEGLKFGKLHQLAEVYECPFEPDMSSLMLWHRLRAPGRRSIDNSGFKHSGFFEGTPRVIRGPDIGVEGGATLALYFDGQHDFVRVPHYPKLGLHKVVTGFSQVIRVAPCSLDQDNGTLRRIISKRDPPVFGGSQQGQAQFGYSLSHDGDRLVYIVLWQGLRYSAEITNPFPTIDLATENGWYMIVTTFDAITKEVKIWLNNTDTQTSIPATNDSAIEFPSNDFELHIARPGTGEPFNEGRYHGGIADFRMYYDLVLDQSQVNNLWVNKHTITPIPRGGSGLSGHSYAIKKPPEGFRGGYSVVGFTNDGFVILKKLIRNTTVGYYNIEKTPTVSRYIGGLYAIEAPLRVRNGLTGVYDLEPEPQAAGTSLQSVYSIIPSQDNPPGGGGNPFPPGLPMPGGLDEFGIGKFHPTTTTPTFGQGQGEYFARSWGNGNVQNFTLQNAEPTLVNGDRFQVWQDSGGGASISIDGQGHCTFRNDLSERNSTGLSIADYEGHLLVYRNNPSEAADPGYQGSRWGPNVEMTFYMTMDSTGNNFPLLIQDVVAGLGGDYWFSNSGCPYNAHMYLFSIIASGHLFFTGVPYRGMLRAPRPDPQMANANYVLSNPWWNFDGSPPPGGGGGGGGTPPPTGGGNTDSNGVRMLYSNTGNFQTDWQRDSGRPAWDIELDESTLNFEMTAYIRAGGGDTVSAKIRGGRHSDDGGTGCCYILQIPTSGGEPRMETECPHPSGYEDCSINALEDSLGTDDWRGVKAICWNINNNQGVHLELWEDQGNSDSSPANQWVKLFQVDDTDAFCCDDCDPFPLVNYDHTDGTQQATFRIDVDGTEAKWLSLVELTGGVGQPNPSGGGSMVANVTDGGGGGTAGSHGDCVAGPYQAIGSPLNSTTRGPTTRHYASGMADDETIEKNVDDIDFDNYQFVAYVTMHDVEHDDTVSVKLGGTHTGTGWFDLGVSFNSGQTCLGTEEDHPSTDLCIIEGPNIGNILEKELGIAGVYFRQQNKVELWTDFEGSGWVKQLEGVDVGGFDPGSDSDEAQLRIDGFSEGDVPDIACAQVTEIGTVLNPPVPGGGTGGTPGGGSGTITFPIGKKVGFKFVRRLSDSGQNVMLEAYRDMSEGQNGGSWHLLMQFKHEAGNWPDLLGGGDPQVMQDLFEESTDNSDSCVFTPSTKDEVHNMATHGDYRIQFGNVGQVTLEKLSIREIDPLP